MAFSLNRHFSCIIFFWIIAFGDNFFTANYRRWPHKNVKVKLMADKSNMLDVRIVDKAFSKERDLFNDKFNVFYSKPEKIDFNIEQVQNIEIVVEFDGVKDGVEESLSRKSMYDVKRHASYSNDIVTVFKIVKDSFTGHGP